MIVCKRLIFIGFLACIISSASAQQPKLVAGPMLGQVELRTARIWIEAAKGSRTAAVRYWSDNQAKAQTKQIPIDPNQDFLTGQVEIGGLDINTTYTYEILINGTAVGTRNTFTTRDLWQYRKPVPDFSFLTGSCAYFNEARYDRVFTDKVYLNRPSSPYGGDSSIFLTMAREPAKFMVWLGDNWYTREVDFSSEWGLWYRASHDRSLQVMKDFFRSMPHYAIWDDHDYGPDNSDKSFILKDASRRVFTSFWANPSYGMNGQGIYTRMSYGDCDFFLMDDRWFRSSDDLPDSVNGAPNGEKRMWGAEQLQWLKNGLAGSSAAFKFIVTGSQTLNTLSTTDCLQHYPVEFNELMRFLQEDRINGVLFLTGDRHHSEVLKYERKDAYPLYDVTSSPLTSGVSKVSGATHPERNNPQRIQGSLVEAQNYSRVSVSGKAGSRALKVEFIGIKGEVLGGWEVNESQLKFPRK